MIKNLKWQQIGKYITEAIGQSFIITKTQPVSGGSINSAYIIQSKTQRYFIKLNQAKLLFMFEAEFAGLEEIAHSKTINVPRPIVSGVLADHSFLVLESISMRSGNTASDQQLGHQLAALHQLPQKFFGWHQNNTIGSTEQMNQRSSDWLTFWKNNRLGFQLSLAEKNGYSQKLISSGKKLSESLHHFFSDYNPQPSLLHGDLWSGNAAITACGEPIIYDPACYYGDRETDIAMTELFGGFSADFYTAYHDSFPLHSDYTQRKTLYNLYHILNHLNLFGAGYLGQAQTMIDQLLADIS